MAEVVENTLVDGRYRILGRIGSGGMADVYRAEDTQLGREVALKVLHRRFAQDAEFVERFRREASSAAALQHPNVVNVFDRGDHDGTYYIAMEHLRGRTLKDVIAAEAPMDEERAIALGLQILQAAGFGHARGVIHRDFKPHNVIVDEDGSAKVTDFGIARAGASEMTETGSIMGTAAYLSPEQAQGHAVTAQSDLYSIGVLLYEMLTGRLPFEGDSAVAIAVKHLSEPPPPLSTLRPDIHPALESTVMGALAKDPAHRWASAEEFAAALETARAQIEAGERGQDTAIFAPVPVPLADGDPATAVAAPAGPVEPAREEDERRGRRWPLFSLGLLVLALLALVVFALTRPEMVDVPKVEGEQLLEARTILERAGFEEIEVQRVSSLAESDRVLDQDPEPGDQAEKDGKITLEVSKGPGQVRVPSVEKLPEERAVKELTRAGLKANIDREPSNEVREGVAIRTVPKEGTEVDRGSRVRLFISAGPEEIEVPNVTGLSRSSAEARLAAEGLGVSLVQRESDEPEDEVIAQDPRPGTRVGRGSRVTITVSSGREQVEVPSVVGLSAGAAAGALRAAGLGVSRRTRPVESESEDGVVVDQRPPPGSQVDRGRTVLIVVGRAREPDRDRDEPGPDGTDPDSGDGTPR